MSYTSVLDYLESESIFIFREAVAQTKKPVLLFSGGKDSAVLLHIALKAFYPSRISFPILHIDTGHNFPEVLTFRDNLEKDINAKLIIRNIEDLIQSGRIVQDDAYQSRNGLQSICLLDAIAEFKFDACFGGARRDEEKSRAKERIFSYRDKFGRWDPKSQRPEVWNLYNGFVKEKEHLRIFPLSNWTELDIWQYIEKENITLPSLYFSHLRSVIKRKEFYVPVSEIIIPEAGEIVETLPVRFRTVGDMSCTCPILSQAKNVSDIIREMNLEKF